MTELTISLTVIWSVLLLLVPISGLGGSRHRNRGGTIGRNEWLRHTGIFMFIRQFRTKTDLGIWLAGLDTKRKMIRIFMCRSSSYFSWWYCNC